MKIIVIASIMAILASGCSFNLRPEVSSETFNEETKIAAKVSIYMPDEFSNYEYVRSYDGRSIKYYFGKSVELAFPLFMKSLFSSAVAYNKDDCVNGFIATPWFLQTYSSASLEAFIIETKIKVDFMSCDWKSISSITGKGFGKAGSYTEEALLRAGNEALNNSLIDLRNKILDKKDIF